MQDTLFGGPPVVSGDVITRLKYILTEHLKARDSYTAAIAPWLELDRLSPALRQALPGNPGHPQLASCVIAPAAFQKWFVRHATAPIRQDKGD